MLFGSGSSVVDITVAVLVSVPVASSDTIPVIKTVLVSPDGNVPKSRFPVHGVSAPPSIENSGFIILGGILSVNITFSALSGPLFVTNIV